MKNNLIDIYDVERSCEYRGEIYFVRNNGAVYRSRKTNNRKRPLDEKWTFGKLDNKKGYLNISSETVHRIVATAFHGPQQSEKHIVDHIDTNKQNNRPENLRWITRLDNILLNPITLSRIIYKYGSIDNFLSDPSKPLNGSLDQNFSWMRTITKEESENAKNNLLNWAKEGTISTGGILGEWIYSNLNQKKDDDSEQNLLIQSITSNAFQKNWKIQSEFPNCPISTNENSLNIYKERLIKGSVFSSNKYGESFVESVGINETTDELLILTSINNQKKFALAKVYIDGYNFIHESNGTFFTLAGGQKQFNIALGKEWYGEDSIDDYL
ncbi:HNH endonuclease [Salegentibacter sp. JZCK2]|uniref:HNH endonuclease signature motif containing protein n=1 Tax=Salegentibacter tibetensis TaxID=2873600 RepID=UPI001CCF4C6B|nr:HNH endonuclease signature motif containing protein [Salegentibacter tibetensis]MBZ9730895.1 HNH endonuclease [Salegentibacter tibetensis]